MRSRNLQLSKTLRLQNRVNMADKNTSYTSADVLPIKVVLDTQTVDHIRRYRRIPPIHAQVIPTNRCNRNCPMCSCSERTKNHEMDLFDVETIAKDLRRLGCRAVTLTGGGEPLVHPQIVDIIRLFHVLDIEIGMTTNGMLLHELPEEVVELLTWCRISNDDSRHMSPLYMASLDKVFVGSSVGWGFSHVVSKTPNFEEIARVVRYANEWKITHVRLIADLFEPKAVDLTKVRQYLYEEGIDDSRVIYQNRQQPVRGGPCYIGYLKPLISADCKVYACCGVQYALDPPTRDLPPELCIGDALDLGALYDSSDVQLNGEICKTCYYDNYNNLLGSLLKDTTHEEFV